MGSCGITSQWVGKGSHWRHALGSEHGCKRSSTDVQETQPVSRLAKLTGRAFLKEERVMVEYDLEDFGGDEIADDFNT